MGARIHAQAPAVNVVAWDWRIPANRRVPIPIVEAACQGPKLGAALQGALGTGYSQPVHFIGHSLGTIVNSRACDYLHGGGSSRFPKAAPPWNPGEKAGGGRGGFSGNHATEARTAWVDSAPGYVLL